MNKLFQKKSFAVAVLVLAILVSSAVGLSKKPKVETPQGSVALDESLNTAAFSQYIVDDAKILSDKTEKSIALYNANWDKRLGAIMAVVTLNKADSAEDAAWEWAEKLELGEDDAILVIVEKTKDYKVVASGGFYDFFADLSASFVDSCMYEGVQKGDYDLAATALFTYVHGELCNAGYYGSGQGGDSGSAVFGIIAVLLLCFFLFMLIDRMRYRRYQRRVNRGVVIVRPYYPIFWGRSRYRRPVSPPRPPRRGGPRPPMGGSHSSGGAFRSKPTTTHHSNFSSHSGSPRSGSFGGGSRGGSFGGGHSGSFGGGRGGGFGGRR